jgi:hypothetical protein
MSGVPPNMKLIQVIRRRIIVRYIKIYQTEKIPDIVKVDLL